MRLLCLRQLADELWAVVIILTLKFHVSEDRVFENGLRQMAEYLWRVFIKNYAHNKYVISYWR